MSRFNRLEFDEGKSPRGSLHSASDVEHEQQRLRILADDTDGGHWMRVALDDRRNGRFENALRHYSRALELDKGLVGGWAGQAQMLIALGEYPEAELWSRKALELFKNNAELLAARAQALCRTGDLRSAQASCDAAIGQQGLFSAPWVARGELMLARKEDIDGYCFDKAVQLDAEWLVPLEIGAIYEHYGRGAKALSRIRQALEKAPDQAYCWYRQGACELALGLTTAAEKSFARCLQLAPNHPGARDELHKLTQNRHTVRRFFKRLFRFSF
jgi:tetratricopeptide (TPR) repeat protein